MNRINYILLGLLILLLIVCLYEYIARSNLSYSNNPDNQGHIHEDLCNKNCGIDAVITYNNKCIPGTVGGSPCPTGPNPMTGACPNAVTCINAILSSDIGTFKIFDVYSYSNVTATGYKPVGGINYDENYAKYLAGAINFGDGKIWHRQYDQNRNTEKWVLEPTGEPDTYYIKNDRITYPSYPLNPASGDGNVYYLFLSTSATILNPYGYTGYTGISVPTTTTPNPIPFSVPAYQNKDIYIKSDTTATPPGINNPSMSRAKWKITRAPTNEPSLMGSYVIQNVHNPNYYLSAQYPLLDTSSSDTTVRVRIPQQFVTTLQPSPGVPPPLQPLTMADATMCWMIKKI